MRQGSGPPRSLTACSFLPPEGAAAPAARQSRFRGPCLTGFAVRPLFAIVLTASCAHPAWTAGKNDAKSVAQSEARPAAADCKPVYLTLDTGHMEVAPLMADILNRHDVKVTFFAANERTKTGDGSLGTYWSSS